MFNTYLWNTNLYNVYGGVFPSVALQDDIAFNGYGLQNNSIVMQILVHDNTSSRDFMRTDAPRSHGMIISGDYWREKRILLKGVVKADTAILLEEKLEDIKKNLALESGLLDIKVNGVIRRYIATLTNGNNMFSERQGFHVSFCPIQLEFTCVDPFGKDTDYTVDEKLGRTILDYTTWLNNAGSIDALPVFIVQFTAATAITEVEFVNNTTDEIIKVTDTFAANDYLVIDCENKEVLKNFAEVEYSGIFPRLLAGANSISLDITGTSATYNACLKFRNTYL